MCAEISIWHRSSGEIDYFWIIRNTCALKILKNISKIIVGYTFRGALPEDPRGDINVLLGKHITNEGVIDLEDLPKIQRNDIRSEAFVKSGDVLLTTRGVFRAAASHDFPHTLASSSIYIIRLIDKNILPEFLSIYLNSQTAQVAISQLLTGSSIKTILRKDLETLPIPVPTKTRQQQIINIFSNWKCREQLLHKKIKLDKNIAEGAIHYLLTL